ncbi:MAG: D-alanyl-D-alanine carboxypeptidase [Chlorobiaceae bacterium]|nr:D-alanyl-D-alanine carboxypeptidase [Chlorobiaceae bacterium]
MSACSHDEFARRKRIVCSDQVVRHECFSLKRLLICAFFAVFSLMFQPIAASAGWYVSAAEESVTSYIVKETGSSHLLMSKEIDKPVSPASLTKIMTCLMAIESGRMDDVITIPLDATEVEPTVAGLKPGDRIRLRDLVKAAMVNSSNDAAFAIAGYLGGSVEGFVASMNNRARALGMNHTWFTNPAGYDRGLYVGNQSSARDLMILTERAIRYPEFNSIAKLDAAVFSELETGRAFYLRTHNKLFDRYPHTVGIKTGYTVIAGPCLIARAIRDGKDMLIVMLGARTDRWSLASAMFDRGFEPGSAEPQMQVAGTQRQDNRKEMAVSVPVVSVGRARALIPVKHNVASQGAARVGRKVNAGGRERVFVAKTSLKSSRDGKSKRRVAVISRQKAAKKGSLALKEQKSASERKKSLVKRTQRDRKGLLAVKSAAQKRSRTKVALNSGNKDRHKAVTARKGASKRSSAQANTGKKRNGKEALSLSGKNAHSPNG